MPSASTVSPMSKVLSILNLGRNTLTLQFESFAPIEIITAPLRGHVGDADIISDNLLSHTASGVL